MQTASEPTDRLAVLLIAPGAVAHTYGDQCPECGGACQALRYRVSVYARDTAEHLETFTVLDTAFLGRWIDRALRSWEEAGQPAHCIVVPTGTGRRIA